MATATTTDARLVRRLGPRPGLHLVEDRATGAGVWSHDVGVHPELLHRRPLQLIGGGSVSAPIPEDDLVAVRDWRSSDRFGRADRAVLAATDETRGSGAISAGTWAELEATVPAERARLEVVIARANWSMFAQLLRSLAPHRRWAGLQSTSSLRCAPPCAD